ncbi:hypothetical protein IMZ31_19525 (plasmid) [Pontibacillus sp. ALD_SL1]|uniref:hypothetical protein n=1 Tax=Pontibacillus sp. ALD_SL1 TaxID=2777185 RepID=UPI001A96E921|nr:hypothetical protein [Pontibacillus sp. ALD_SL1]QST02742.1 hypothetical protein IMZ31_19525 [Pontibacillus sp. ALD_SL1]
MELIKGNVKVSFVNIGEGISGDYDPKNPNDVNLLRFDVEVLQDGDWEPVSDASYCTAGVTADATEEQIQEKLQELMDAYYEPLHSYPETSVKKIGEKMSYLTI